jgi:hypothetical protein
VTFASADDVKHYLETDDVHMEFAVSRSSSRVGARQHVLTCISSLRQSRVKPLLADAFIYDFETVEA